MPLLPKDYLNAVVVIEDEIEAGKFRPCATAFLAGFLTGKFDENNNKLYLTFLITNKHVFEGKQKIWLRFNITDVGLKRYELVLKTQERNLWVAHPNKRIDIAIVPIPINQLKEDRIAFYFFPEEEMAFRNTVKQLEIAQGDGVFVLGFPMGIAGEERNYVIVRSGIIARLDDEIIDKYSYFLIDSTILPGNSGGPVILKPAATSLTGTKPVLVAYLLGIVRGYIPYEENAVSTQTGKTRITFVENSGLATVIPIDFVKEIVDTLQIKTS